MKVIDFGKALEKEEQADNETKEFVDSMLSLGKEIAAKGLRGEQVTEAEHRFMKSSALFFLRGLIEGGRKH